MFVNTFQNVVVAGMFVQNSVNAHCINAGCEAPNVQIVNIGDAFDCE